MCVSVSTISQFVNGYRERELTASLRLEATNRINFSTIYRNMYLTRRKAMDQSSPFVSIIFIDFDFSPILFSNATNKNEK